MSPNLIIMLEIARDIKELNKIGLNQEEIEGYLEMFIENYEFYKDKEIH